MLQNAWEPRQTLAHNITRTLRPTVTTTHTPRGGAPAKTLHKARAYEVPHGPGKSHSGEGPPSAAPCCCTPVRNTTPGTVAQVPRDDGRQMHRHTTPKLEMAKMEIDPLPRHTLTHTHRGIPLHACTCTQVPSPAHAHAHTWKDTQMTTDVSSGSQSPGRYDGLIQKHCHKRHTRRDSWPALSTWSCSDTHTLEGRHCHTDALGRKRVTSSSKSHAETSHSCSF